VNPDAIVDGYTETLNTPKSAKDNNLVNTKKC